MGRHSDSDEDSYKRSKKSKKRKSRSRSRSSSDTSYSSSKYSKHKKAKKSKHRKKTSRSRSRSPDKYGRSRRRSRSRSFDRRSRSGSRTRRKRSRSKSRDRLRRSRSKSWERSRRRSRSKSRSRRGRSRSREKEKSRSRKSSQSPSNGAAIRDKKPSEDPCANVPGFEDMTPAQKAEIRMRLALKAAAEADQKLRDQGALISREETESFDEHQKKVKAIEDIERPEFAPMAFKSSRGEKQASSKQSTELFSHEDAIFGTNVTVPMTVAPFNMKYKESDAYSHPNLLVTTEDKMDRWVKKLKSMRQRKLEGEAMN